MEIKKKNKKAQVFTVLAIVLLLLLYSSFEIFSYIREKEAIKTRVSTMDSFLRSLEGNLQRQLYIAGFRMIFLAEDEITTSGNYISNLDDFFEEVYFNGTVDGVEQGLMIEATYPEMIDSINEKASKINVNITLSNSVLEVSQTDPWHVKFVLSSDFIMNDKQNLASWEKTQNITTFVTIEGFEDPIFTLEVGGGFSKTINQTPYEGYYITGSDVTNLSDHLLEGYYSANSDAPSFLNRLNGNFSSNENGIESFVRSSDVSFLETKTLIDHIYFTASNPAFSTVSGMPSWFRIDDAHKLKYNVTT